MAQKRSNAPFQLPYVTHGYTLMSCLGEGGFSWVFKASDEKYSMDFAVKVMEIQQGTRHAEFDAFMAEIECLKRLYHPNIIQMYNHFIEKNLLFIVLEYCPNGTLEQEILTDGVDPNKLLIYVQQIAKAVEFCHSNNIAHRDIKPSNILFDIYNRPKLADFGIALRSRENVRHFVGSVQYLPPELLLRKAYDPILADIWALGVVFYRMLTGRHPFPADSLSTLTRVVSCGLFDDISTHAHPLATAIRGMIQVTPKDRKPVSDIVNNPDLIHRIVQKTDSERLTLNALKKSKNASLAMSSQFQLHSQIYSGMKKLRKNSIPLVSTFPHLPFNSSIPEQMSVP